MQPFDLVIAGGGAVGCALALALSRLTDLNIALIEKSGPVVKSKQSTDTSFSDARVIALAEQSWQFLTSLGIEHALRAKVTPIHHIHVSDRGHLGHCDMTADEYQVDALGYVCGLSSLVHILEQALEKTDVCWFRPEHIEHISQQSDAIEIKTQHNDFKAALLVVAEGGTSETRRMLGFTPQQQSYEQVALVTNVRASVGHQHIAYERFTEDGPLAFLPMGGNEYSVVWSLKPQECERLLAVDDQDFLAELQQAFGYRAGLLETCSSRQHFPLGLMTSDRATGHRCALVGNALHTLHPIAGQGLNLGLRDIDELVRQIVSAKAEDIGSFEVLHAYQKTRLTDQKRVIRFTDGLVRCFSNQMPPLVIGRNMGLFSMQLSSFLKQPLARQAMGHRDR